MLYSGSCSGFLSVRFFLGFGELMIPGAFFMDCIRHATVVNDCFLPDIDCVRVELLAGIAFIDKDFKFLRVVD